MKPEPLVELSTWLQHNYPISASHQIDLLRAYTNQVYRILAGDERYVLKIYQPSWRRVDEIKYEIDLLFHLDRGGLPVAKPLQALDTGFVKSIPTSQGDQHAVLYEFAAGEKPQPPFSQPLYFLFGQAIARMHEISKEFYLGLSKGEH